MMQQGDPKFLGMISDGEKLEGSLSPGRLEATTPFLNGHAECCYTERRVIPVRDIVHHSDGLYLVGREPARSKALRQKQNVHCVVLSAN